MIALSNERRLPEFDIESLRSGCSRPPKSDLRMETIANVLYDILAVVGEAFNADKSATTWAYTIDFETITPTVLGMVVDHLKACGWKCVSVIGDYIVLSTLDSLVPHPLPEPLASEVRRQAEQSAPVEEDAKIEEPVHA